VLTEPTVMVGADSVPDDIALLIFRREPFAAPN